MLSPERLSLPGPEYLGEERGGAEGLPGACPPRPGRAPEARGGGSVSAISAAWGLRVGNGALAPLRVPLLEDQWVPSPCRLGWAEEGGLPPPARILGLLGWRGARCCCPCPPVAHPKSSVRTSGSPLFALYESNPLLGLFCNVRSGAALWL